jgi:thiamine kinase-like enzyme
LPLPAAIWQYLGMTDEDRIKALPCWNGAIDIAPLGGGLSNANYVVRDRNGKHAVRLGADYPFHHVSREREVMVARAAHRAGFAPDVEYADEGAMVTAFLEAKTFTAADVRHRTGDIALLLRRFHAEMAQHVSGTAVMFWVFHVIRDYVRILRNERAAEPERLDGFLAVARHLEAVRISMPIVFGHHDLLPANFLDDGERLWLIDFEYAGFGTAMFDLAGVSSHAGLSGHEQQGFLRAYLGHGPDAPFLKAFAAMECASLLRETLWALVSGLYLAAPGVDYGAYAFENQTRFEAALDHYQAQYGILPA